MLCIIVYSLHSQKYKHSLRLQNLKSQMGKTKVQNNGKQNINGCIVSSAYLFQNGMVATFGHENKQMPKLQGRFSAKLMAKIRKQSDVRTKWNGF